MPNSRTFTSVVFRQPQVIIHIPIKSLSSTTITIRNRTIKAKSIPGKTIHSNPMTLSSQIVVNSLRRTTQNEFNFVPIILSFHFCIYNNPFYSFHFIFCVCLFVRTTITPILIINHLLFFNQLHMTL